MLKDLEHIDDECDKNGIQFVKIGDEAAAIEYGIEDLPKLVYFEKNIPNVYEGMYNYHQHAKLQLTW